MWLICHWNLHDLSAVQFVHRYVNPTQRKCGLYVTGIYMTLSLCNLCTGT